jgi:cyanophycinase
MKPKGTLIIIGGHEDKGEVPGENLAIQKNNSPQSHFEILGRLILKTPRLHHVIEIIAAASSIPEEMEQLYVNSYKQVGFTQVGIIKVENEAEANDPVSIKRIQNAHAVFFTGGDQTKLIAALEETDLLKAIHNKYLTDPHFIVGGTSAGAMAIPETILAGGIIGSALFKKDLRMATGLSFIRGLLVDTHFIKRGRFARLAHAVALHPECIGVGLEEDTALIITEGEHAECIGSGMVVVIDGSKMTGSNVNTADEATPLVMENLQVSILAEGSAYKFKRV